ncbi:hypothetical protein FOXB_04063 [Fusarium oxysporum f. sp. conglutinans Fo5176]|uniref:HTH CENPB-type domain-containing protein n=1 Tax=Fusarium oxysporum (strain Fo5176) TaxID=660025 RepID=F9FCD5_FUSOF|nr:hypothetical protein FOXB_04063 [Fusarium oxysporum f. sp. conglutinans Fo5176]
MPRYLELADVKEADYIFISHAHFDHLPGADVIAKRTGAIIVANGEAINIMREAGVPEKQLLPVGGGERIPLFTKELHDKAAQSLVELERRPPGAPKSPHPSLAVAAVHVWPSLHAFLPEDHPEIMDTGVRYTGASTDFFCTLNITMGMKHGLLRLKDVIPEDKIDQDTQAFIGYVDDRDKNRFSHYDGGQLMFNILTEGQVLLWSAHLGGYEGVLRDLTPRPDVAIIAAAGRANLNGRPFDGSAAEFWLKRRNGLKSRRRLYGACMIKVPGQKYKNIVTYPTTLQALHKDPKLRPRRAAEIYNVHYRTLYRRQKGTQSRSDCIPKSRRLSNLEEQVIVEHILDLDSRGCPPRLRDVEEIANQLLADRQAQPVSKNWASNYIKRQPELKTRFQRRYDYQRARCEDPIVIRNWFRLVQNTIAKYGTRSDDIYNFDETGFAMGMIGSGPGNREWVTVIQAINAEGWAVQPFIVFAGQNHLANWYRESNLPGDWVITTTQNGWTDNQTGLGWLKHFDRCTANRSVGSYRLLILDGHESHQSFNFERYCKQNNIIPLYMPPPSSHLLQPLDVGCFGPLKKAYGREIEHLIRRSITHVSKTEFLPAFYAASQATMTEKNIKGGFKGAGLVPLDPESVISKLDVQLRTPTPAEEVAESSTPWVSKTPKTIIEIETFSEKLKVGIKRHKDSSPESIIAAVTTFEKGSKMEDH